MAHVALCAGMSIHYSLLGANYYMCEEICISAHAFVRLSNLGTQLPTTSLGFSREGAHWIAAGPIIPSALPSS